MNTLTSEKTGAGFRPLVINAGTEGSVDLRDLIKTHKPTVVDTIEEQLMELVKMERPDYVFSDEEARLAARARLGENPENYGCWVYFPWKNTVVHLLGETEFVKVRTNRNHYKITPQEQDLLARKRVGIIGLSVGSGVALAMAMERTAGELRIADYDTLDLSNMNRLRTSVTNLGVAKAELVAREIAEIDPFLKVTLYSSGITAENIAEFLDGNDAPLDLLVEECDSLPIKILARVEARRRALPVIMETSDRGMVDVERFDIDQNLGILHGRITDAECEELLTTGTWTPEVTAKIMTMKETSDRMRRSVMELGKTITRWPQLASEVTAGAGVVTHLSRKILLGDHLIRGRKFLDPYELFVD